MRSFIVGTAAVFLAFPVLAATCPVASPDQSVVAMAGPTLSDGNCGSWAISATAQATYNGTAIPGTANVKQLALAKNVVWQLNTAGNWYSIARSAAGVFSSPVGPTTTSPLTAVTTTVPPPASPKPTGKVTVTVPIPTDQNVCISLPSGATYLYSGGSLTAASCP